MVYAVILTWTVFSTRSWHVLNINVWPPPAPRRCRVVSPTALTGCAGKLRRIPPGFGPDGWGLMATSGSTPAAGRRRRVHWPQKDVAAEDRPGTVMCRSGAVPCSSFRVLFCSPEPLRRAETWHPGAFTQGSHAKRLHPVPAGCGFAVSPCVQPDARAPVLPSRRGTQRNIT